MANIKSAKKRILTAEANSKRNKADRTKLKSVLKKANAAFAAGEASQESTKLAVVSIDKAVSKNLIHKNKAARLKSQLAKKANASA